MNDRLPEDAPKGNGSRRPVQIMAEINHTRDEMDQTLNAIEQRLTPGQLVDQGLDYLKHSGAREYASNLGASLKTNPLPATLCGIGLAWLMAVGNRPPQPSSDAGVGPGIGERMQSAKDGVTGGMQSAKDSVTSGMQSAKQSMASGVQSARERASQLGDTAGRQLDRARDNWNQILEENPLVLGAVGLAIGALAGAIAPRTRTEDELMGETRDDLVEQAKKVGGEKLEQAKQTATAAATSVKDAAADAAKRQADKAGAQPSATPAPSAVEKTEDSTKWPASTR